MARKITYRHNIMSIGSLESFLSIKGGYNGDRRDVYFVRALGCGPDTEYKIFAIDKKMAGEMRNKRLFYTRVKSLPRLTSRTDMDFYEKQFKAFQAKKEIFVQNQEGDGRFGSALSDACLEAADRYRHLKKNITESIEKNFIIKLLYWTDCVLGTSLAEWNERGCYKILAEDVQKEQEYLFYYMLTLIGCDVLLLEYRKDIETAAEIKGLSKVLELGEFRSLALPEYRADENEKSGINSGGDAGESEMRRAGGLQQPERIRPTKPVNQPERIRPTKPIQQPERICPAKPIQQPENCPRPQLTEKSFEELARLASSIVMIAVYDRKGSPVATGSGIMIGRAGYILTNNHVTAGGCFFDVRIEDDEKVYRTNEIIKYNSVLDLAVIRIDRCLEPLPIYRGKKSLVRGQKVVAIGSPLGLFNSVSDGIISGFRKIDSVNMIQFTAPISHGSSGGAVLNMQGEVIGISTAGFDEGQNINLAVNYEDIGLFVRGFTD